MASGDPLPPRYTARSASTSKRPVPQDDTQPDAALLVKKYVELDQYRIDVQYGNFEKLSVDERRTRFGSEHLPIFVPLARGESMQQYEKRFVEWLSRARAMTIQELQTEKLRPVERRLRTRFALLNVHGDEQFEPVESPGRKRVRRSDDRSRSRERIVEKRTETETTARRLRDAPDGRRRDVNDARNESGDKKTSHRCESAGSERNASHGTNEQRHELEKDKEKLPGDKLNDTRAHAADERVCTLTLPPSSPKPSAIAVLVAAYVACACQSCLMKAVTHMATRVSELEKKVNEGCSCASTRAASKDPVADITCDDDRQSPAETSVGAESSRSSSTTTTTTTSAADAAEAITRLVLARSSASELPTPTAPTRSKKKKETDDPVEQQLAKTYDIINKRISVNEKTLDVSTARLANTPAMDIDELAQLHDEKDELAATIQSDAERRTRALAALVVYLWRHERAELERIVNDTAASNVPHVQAVGHRKCATLATTIVEKRVYGVKIRTQLDAAMQGDDHETKRLTILQELGERLAATEREIEELLTQRRREFATIIHFDDATRRAIRAKLEPAPPT